MISGTGVVRHRDRGRRPRHLHVVDQTGTTVLGVNMFRVGATVYAMGAAGRVEVAERTGQDITTVAGWAAVGGIEPPSLAEVEVLAGVLGVEVAWFYTYDESTHAAAMTGSVEALPVSGEEWEQIFALRARADQPGQVLPFTTIGRVSDAASKPSGTGRGQVHNLSQPTLW